MRTILRILAISLGIILLVAINIGLSYILPFPYSKLNILFAIIILLMLWWNSGFIVWLSFFSHLFMELYTTTPFGVILFSSTISILFSYWLYKYIFTNRSILSTIALASFTLIIFRLIYTFLLIICKIFNIINDIPWKLISITFIWEFVTTLLFVIILYFILNKITHRFNMSVIEKYTFKI